VKTKLKRRLLLAAALLGAVGCGGNDASGITTYVYESARPVGVAAQTCILVSGPITVGPGWMDYAIENAAGTDSIRALIISDSYYSSYQCGFSEHPVPPSELALDVSFAGSSTNQDKIYVVADAYDFVIKCENPYVDCAFDLTWSATYQ
jgi:hypothetical protein